MAYGRPEWDDLRATGLVGSYALVGVTVLEADGATIRQSFQIHGRIKAALADRGICIVCEGALYSGQDYWLPPDLSVFNPASPGDYHLKATNEVVTDPDIVAAWTITKAAE